MRLFHATSLSPRGLADALQSFNICSRGTRSSTSSRSFSFDGSFPLAAVCDRKRFRSRHLAGDKLRNVSAKSAILQNGVIKLLLFLNRL
jgi:hypothetical protein